MPLSNYTEHTVSWCLTSTCIADAVYDWQTLITGLLAVAAAFATVWLGQRQIKLLRDQWNHQREDDNRRYNARLKAIRLGLVSAIDAILQYAEHVIGVLSEEYNRPAGADRDVISSIAFPVFAVSSLERLVEFSENEDIVGTANYIVAEAQHIDMFCRSLLLIKGSRNGYGKSTIANYIIETVAMHTNAWNLMGYARNSVDDVRREDSEKIFLESFDYLFKMNRFPEIREAAILKIRDMNK